ncbi:MAG TPA: efflux RND transporter periplasmic adaptor subunit [Candidatus Angelobacter sp.]
MKTTVAIALAGLFFASGCSKSGNQQQASGANHQARQAQDAKSSDNFLRIEPEMLRDLRITTSAVEQRRSGDGVNLLGEVTVNEEAYAQVGSPIPARVVSIAAAPGQQVSKGQPLAVLQSTELGKARSENISAQARLQLARQTLDRKRRLVGEHIVAQRDVQEAEASVAAAEADLRSAQATLRALGATDDAPESSEVVLRSPISGTVIDRTALRGQLADPAQPLFKVADLRKLWLTVHAFERDAVRLQLGKTAKITFPALPGRTFFGTVTLIGKQVDPTSRTVPIRIEIANADGILRPGMSATARVPSGQATQEVITVPAASVQRLENDWYVFIPRSQDTYELRKIGRGRDLEGEIEVVTGLKPGEIVVVDGAFLLKAEAEKARGEGKEHEHE